jgi:hypothetical protein
MAQQAMSDPAYQSSLGLEIELDPARAGDRLLISKQAAVLRGCAKKIIPTAFDWDIQTTIGGGAFLILKGLRDIETELHD